MKKIIYFGKKDARIVLIQFVDDHDMALLEKEYELISGMTKNMDFLLAGVKAESWNDELSPWPAEAVFGKEGFGGKAADTLDYVVRELLPALDSGVSVSREYYIGGYSLAGLFALWAVHETDRFSGAAAASPSVWFPGFTEYMKENPVKTDAVYLSLGDKEEKTRNRVMATVGGSIRFAEQYLTECGVPCVLEWNRGNHFKEPDLRTAKAFAWLLNRIPADR